MIHYNIGQNKEINPFEGVKYVRLNNHSYNNSIRKLHESLNRKSLSVETRKIGDCWEILYDISLLDYTVLLKWDDINRGSFIPSFANTRGSVFFTIEGDTMNCW